MGALGIPAGAPPERGGPHDLPRCWPAVTADSKPYRHATCCQPVLPALSGTVGPLATGAREPSIGRVDISLQGPLPSTPVARSAGPCDLLMVEDEEGSLSVRPVTSGSSDRADVDGTKASTTSFIFFQDFELSAGKCSILLL